MLKRTLLLSLRAFIIALCASCVSLSALSQVSNLKQSAPERYTVKKGDTLWDISSMYLDQPWLWPELWRNNTQIENPHLIYPGDVIVLRYVEGEPVLSVARTKQKYVLSPSAKRKDKTQAVSILPWDVLSLYANNSWLVSEDMFETLPRVLGNEAGAVRFSNDDILLTRRDNETEEQYYVVRNKGSIDDMQGISLGYQLDQVAKADLLEDGLETKLLVRVVENKQEVLRGDMLWATAGFDETDIELSAAEEGVRGHVVGSLHEYAMFGKFDVVIVDVASPNASPGTVLGVYMQGPDIIDDDLPRYADEASDANLSFDDGSTVTQPAVKIGQAVVFAVFENASYAIVTRADVPIKRGFIVGTP